MTRLFVDCGSNLTSRHEVVVLGAPEVSPFVDSDDPDDLMQGRHIAETCMITVKVEPAANSDHSLAITVNERAQGKVRLFHRVDDRWTDLGCHDAWPIALPSLDKQEIVLGVTATALRGSRDSFGAWDGRFSLTMSLTDHRGLTLQKVSQDFVVAPFMLCSSLDPVDEVLVVRNSRTSPVVGALEMILPQTGAKLTTIEVQDGDEYDVWIQDAVEIGTTSIPTPSGLWQVTTILPGLRAQHQGIKCEPLDHAVRQHFSRRRAIIADVASPRADTAWIDWFGNLEVSPPVIDRHGREFPFGRILTGVQPAFGMHPDILAFLEEQRIQAPALVLDTSWLLIGHVDEVVSFVPVQDRPGFRVLFPSTALARRILAELTTAGLGDLAVFENHHHGKTTIATLLEGIATSDENRNIQALLDQIKAQLCDGLGLDDSCFIEVPALFEAGTALIPNLVNSLIVHGHVIAPDPCGPRVDGQDAFANPFTRTLRKYGVQVHFVDIWDCYHSYSGEIHCGTNTIRRTPHAEWWQTEPR